MSYYSTILEDIAFKLLQEGVITRSLTALQKLSPLDEAETTWVYTRLVDRAYTYTSLARKRSNSEYDVQPSWW